jgi:hypothetical protein
MEVTDGLHASAFLNPVIMPPVFNVGQEAGLAPKQVYTQ